MSPFCIFNFHVKGKESVGKQASIVMSNPQARWTLLSRSKVYRHRFLVVSFSKLIRKQKQKKILKLDQICDSMVQTRIFYFKPFGNDNQNKTTPLIKKC